MRLSPGLPFFLLNYAFGVIAVKPREDVLGSWLGLGLVAAFTVAIRFTRMARGHFEQEIDADGEAAAARRTASRLRDRD